MANTQRKYAAEPRAQGRTFRYLLKAILSASEGKQVIYLTGSRHLVDWYMNKCRNLIAVYLSPNFYKCSGHDHTIKFGNGGCIYFRMDNPESTIGMQAEEIRDY